MTEKKILIFGGTTEGRKLTEYLAARKVRVHVCDGREQSDGCI